MQTPNFSTLINSTGALVGIIFQEIKIGVVELYGCFKIESASPNGPLRSYNHPFCKVSIGLMTLTLKFKQQ
jgi:hypothetical protein